MSRMHDQDQARIACLGPAAGQSLSRANRLFTLSFTLPPPPLFPKDLSLEALAKRGAQTAGALASGIWAVRTVRRIFEQRGVEVQGTLGSVRLLFAYLVLETWAAQNPLTHPDFLAHLIPVIISIQALHPDALLPEQVTELHEALQYAFDLKNETQLFHCRSGIFSHLYRYLASDVHDAQMSDALEWKAEGKGQEAPGEKGEREGYGLGEIVAGFKQGLMDHVVGPDPHDPESAAPAMKQLCDALKDDDPYTVTFNVLVDMEGARERMRLRREARAEARLAEGSSDRSSAQAQGAQGSQHTE